MINLRRAWHVGAVLTTLALLFSLVAQATGSPGMPSEPALARPAAVEQPRAPLATFSSLPHSLPVTTRPDGLPALSSAPPAAAARGRSGPVAKAHPSTSARPAKAHPAPVTTCPRPAATVQHDAPGRGRTVALTFDDGPGRDTAAIMAILAKYKVIATFFNLGANEQRNPAVVRAEQRAGYPIGDHTWDHMDLGRLSAAGQVSEMDRERAVQHSITGHEPCLLRPPYGSFTATTLALARARQMTVWNWSVDTEDWKADGSGAAYWVHRIVTRAEAGSSQQHPVILMHNQPAGNPATVAALPTIIQHYQRLGYRFVDLLGRSR